jgi:hypothetical protein
MIIDAHFIKGNIRLADHLLAEKNNRTVRELTEHDRDAPLNLHQSLRMFQALTAAHNRAKISFVHVIMAPAHELSDNELDTALVMIDNEHGVNSHARKVVAHGKGDRATHYHIVYPAIGPNGRAAKSQRSHIKDELIARRLEMHFNERIQNGKHHYEVGAILRERGLDLEAEQLMTMAGPASSRRIQNSEKQQGVRLNMRPENLQAMIVEAWGERSRYSSFAEALAAKNVVVGYGNKQDVLVAVHPETGLMLPLRRAMYKDAKISAANLRLHFPEPIAASMIAERGRSMQNRQQQGSNTNKRIHPVDDRTISAPSTLETAPVFAPIDSSPSERESLVASNRRAANAARNARIEKSMALANRFGNRRTRHLFAWITAVGLVASGAAMPTFLAAYGILRVAPLFYASGKRREARQLIAARNADREIQRMKFRPSKPRVSGDSMLRKALGSELIPKPQFDVWAPRLKQRTTNSKKPNKISSFRSAPQVEA